MNPSRFLTFERAAIVLLACAVCYLLGRNSAPLHANSKFTDPAAAEGGTANSNNRMIAVTGPYQQGVSLLYLIDTEAKQLAVYEARGGSRSSGKINFIGARRIDLDLRLDGYHDDSEFSFADLAAQFRKTGWTDVPTGNATPQKPEAPQQNPPEKPSDK